MNKLLLLGIIGIAASISFGTAFAAAHLTFDSFDALNIGKGKSTLVADMGGNFQGQEGNGLFGVVAFGPRNLMLGVFSHSGISDSEIASGGSDGTSHTHLVKTKRTAACAVTENAEPFENIAIRSATFKEKGTLSFNANGDEITVTSIRGGGIGNKLTGAGASVTLVGAGGDICIKIINTVP